jgi:hypothetical protein
MAETKLEKCSSDQSSDVADGLTRRELLKRGGKVAAVAAVSSVFSPFFIHSARAATKTLSFWQFYAPNGISNLQSKWFVDCVAAWNSTHDVKVELQYVPNNDYMNGSKLQTAFASGQGPDIFIISPGDFLRYYNRGEPRLPPEVYKTVSDSIQACQLSGADPKQTAEQGAQQIDSFLAGYSGAPLL